MAHSAVLVAMAGLPASGKSAIAGCIQKQLSAVLLDKDEVREFLFNDAVDYQREQDDLCVNVIYDVACYHLAKRPGVVVILDGRSYTRRYQVQAVKDAASRAHARLIIIECVCSIQSARHRLESDAGVHLAKNRDFLMYQNSRNSADEIQEPKLIVDTDTHTAEEGARLALSYIEKNRLCL